MTASPGTFENIALILGDALSPLAQRLQPNQLEHTLALLGLRLPARMLPAGATSAFGAAASAAQELPGLVSSLVNSIATEAGAISIAADAVRLAEKVARIIQSAVTVADAIRNANIQGINAGDLQAFATALPGRLVEMAITDYLRQRQPLFASVADLLGIVETTVINPGSDDFMKPQASVDRLRFERIGDLLSSPEDLVAELYGWGGAGFDADLILERMGAVITSLRLPVAVDQLEAPDSRRFIEFLIARLMGTPSGVAPKGLDLVLSLAMADDFALDIDLPGGLQVNLGADGSASVATTARFQPPAEITLIPPGAGTQIQGEIRAGLSRIPVGDEEYVTLIGVVGGSRLQANRIGLGAKAMFAWDAAQDKATGDVGFEGKVEGGKLVVSLAEADGFIGTVMGGFGLEADFNLGFGWTAGGGVYFTGSGGLEVQVPTHISLGPIEIQNIGLRLGIDGSSFPIDMTSTIKANLGPLQAVVEDIGARGTLSFPGDSSGNLGIANIAISFKAPTGVGLSLDVGVVKGGGFLRIDPERGEYSGFVELVLAEVIAIRAFGLINTKNPDGTPGFSLIMIMSVEFGTGIQLGYGFTLLGIGGLLGLNRTMNLEALMMGVRTGAVQSIMFPQDIVANAPRILSDLRTLFPMEEGTFLIGPMLKIGWGTPTLVSLSVGVIIEIPGNIAIVGVLKVALPTEQAPLIVLQVNFAGAIEFDKQRLFFFASLYESRILFMTIAGEMGLLVAWGDDANFVLTVGGFHPRFLPPPLPFPSPVRISVSIIDTDYARIRVQGYLAVTSNTAQFGARASLFFGFSELSVEGSIGFDALFQFSPLYFIIDVSASVSLRAFGVGLFSIRLEFSLEGPTPWRARGTGHLEILFFEISADFDISWGDPSPPALEPIDVVPLLAAEFNKDECWTAKLPAGSNLSVTLRSLEGEASALVLHPVGSLQVLQKAVPLDLTIVTVGNRKARDATKFELTVTSPSLASTGALSEQFALGQYLKLKDAEKLSRPAYERQTGGAELSVSGASARSARAVKRVVRFERVVIDNQFRRNRFRFMAMSSGLFAHLAGGASVSNAALSNKKKIQLDPFNDALAVTGDSFMVASTATNKAFSGTAMFASESAALEHQASLVAADPKLASTLHVIPSAEGAFA